MARNIVSTQIIEWKFEDKVSQSLNKVEDSLKKVKTIAEANGFSIFSKKMDEAKTSADKLTDSTNKIGKTDNLDKATTRVEKYAKKVKETPKERMTRYHDNLATQTSKIAGFIKKIASIPKTIKSYVQLNSESATTRMEKYHRKISRLPKNVLTRLKTHIDQGADKFKRSISQIPKKVKTFFETNSEQETPRVEKYGFSLKKILGISALVSVAQKGLSAITNSLGAAFQRSDALHNYTKTLKILEFNGKDAADSQKRLTDMVTGTAFGLDQAAQSTKTFIASGRGLKESEGITKDLMKAVTVFGDGSKASFDMVTMQMGQMAGKSKANMGDLKTVMEQAPGVMQKVAKDMGMSMADFQDAMGQGKITTQDFFDHFHKAMGDFDDSVLKGNDTWQKVFDNSKAKISISLSEMVDNISGTIDKAFGGSVKEKVVTFFGTIGDKLKKAGNVMGEVIVLSKPLVDGFKPIGEAIKRAFSPLEESKKKFDWQDVFKTIINGFVVIEGWVAKLIEPLSKIGGALLEGIIEPFGNLFNTLKNNDPKKFNFDKIVEFLSNIAKHPEAIKKTGTALVFMFGAFKGISAIGAATKALTAFRAVALGKLINSAFITGLTTLVKIPFKAISLGVRGLATGFKLLKVAVLGNPFVALGVAFYELYKHNKRFKKFIDDIAESVKSFFKAVAEKVENAWKSLQKVGKAISKGWKSFWKGVSKTAKSFIDSVGKLFSKLGKAFDKYLLKPIEKVLKTIGKVFLYTFAFIVGVLIAVFEKPVKQVVKLLTKFAKTIGKLWTGLSKTTHKIFSGIGKSISNTWTGVSKTTSKVWNTIIKALSKIFSNISKSVTRTFTGIYKTIKGIFETVWKFIHGIWTRIFNTISDFLSKIFRKISQVFSSIFDTIRNIFNAIWKFFRDIWNRIYSVAESAVHRLSGVIARVVKSISDNWSRAWNGIKDVFGKVWQGMKDLASDGINVVIKYVNKGIGGINGVIHAFGGKKETIAEIKPVKLAQGTRSHRGGFAMLNDDGTPDPREIAILPSGKMIMPQERNVVMPLPQGTEVLNSRETKEFLGGSIPRYAEGTGIWDMMKGMFKWGEEKLDGITSFLKDPLGNLTKIWDKLAEGLMPKSTAFGAFAYNGGRKILSSGKDWIAKLLNDLKSKMEDDGGGEFDGAVGAQGVYKYLEDIFHQLQKKWPALQITSGYRPGDPHFHGKHMAMDVAGGGYGGTTFEDIANYAFDHFKERVAYVITNGRTRDRKGLSGTGVHDGWAAWPDNDHYDHVHINGAWGPGYGGPKGKHHDFKGNWGQTIREAASKMKVSVTDADVGNILSLIQHESGGNEKVIQSSAVWDVNTASGNPAKGLLQYIPKTFAAYAMPGHTNIFSGYDQLLAFFNTASWRNFNPMGGWGPSGPRRFALGGHVTEPTMALIGEHNGEDEYIINPHQPTAHGLLQEAALKAGYKFNINETNSLPAELIAYLKEIILALRENKKVYIDVGGQLVEVTDKQLGDKQQKNDRLFLGGGRTDDE